MPWRADSEETIKTRKNALRVIVTKFRHFWPTESEAKLAYRAGVVEHGVYECSSSKTEYISLLQRDLNVITQRKELERKALRSQIQTSGDLHALEESRGSTNQSSQSSDARSKFIQKILYMEKKHQQLFLLARQQEDRIQNPADSTSTRQVIATFRSLAQAKDRGPFDIDQLNKVDEHLERIRLSSRSTSSGRSLVSKETLEKQNDRTQQVGARAVEKFRKLCKERPIVVTDLAWSVENEVPSLVPPLPPELVLLNEDLQNALTDEFANETQRVTKRRKILVEEKEKTSENEQGDQLLTQVVHSGRVRPFCSSGVDCVPSVRESHIESAPMLTAKSKGYVDQDIPNDSEHTDFLSVVPNIQMPLSLEAALEQLKLAAFTVRDAVFLDPEPLVDADLDQVDRCYSECMIRQKEKSRSGDGTSQQHTAVLRIFRDIDKKDPLPWDCKITCLRQLPLVVSVSPDCLVDVSALVQKGGTKYEKGTATPHTPGQWLKNVVHGLGQHLSCLDKMWTEVDALLKDFSPFLSAKFSRCHDNLTVGFDILFTCKAGEEKMGPELLLTVTSWDGFEGYPRLQPHYEILGLNKGLQSAHVFEMKFKESVEMLAAPLSVSEIVRIFLNAVGSSVDDCISNSHA